MRIRIQFTYGEMRPQKVILHYSNSRLYSWDFIPGLIYPLIFRIALEISSTNENMKNPFVILLTFSPLAWRIFPAFYFAISKKKTTSKSGTFQETITGTIFHRPEFLVGTDHRREISNLILPRYKLCGRVGRWTYSGQKGPRLMVPPFIIIYIFFHHSVQKRLSVNATCSSFPKTEVEWSCESNSTD